MGDTSSTRRQFVAALGVAGTVSLAGCSAIPGIGNAPTTTRTQRPKTTSTKRGTQRPKTTSTGRGTVVDDFEGDVDSRWGVSNGKYTVTNQDTFQGDQSLVLEPKKSANQPVTKIFKSFYPETLDLSKHDLTMAVKVEKPEALKISAEIIAPARSDYLTSTRYIPKELDGWVRYDLGYTGKRGSPNLKNVQQLNIQIGPTNKPFRVLIDDIRKIPKPTTGKVMFHFDDNAVSQYEVAYPEFKKRDWPGAIGVIPDTVGGDRRLTNGMLRELGKAGWDMMSHPHLARPYPAYPPKKQRQEIQQAYNYLKLKGFTKGARHFVAPYNRVNKKTLEIVREFHETCFLFGGAPSNALKPSNPYVISRVAGTDPRGVRRVLNLAEEFNQLVVVYYHRIAAQDAEYSIPKDIFMNTVNHVEKKDIDVITPSQLIDRTQ